MNVVIMLHLKSMATGMLTRKKQTVPKHLMWSESAWWLLSSSICKIPRAFIMPMGMYPLCPHRQMTMALHIYKTGQDSSNELYLESTGPVVPKLQHPQSLGRPAKQTDREHSIVLLFFLPSSLLLGPCEGNPLINGSSLHKGLIAMQKRFLWYDRKQEKGRQPPGNNWVIMCT